MIRSELDELLATIPEGEWYEVVEKSNGFVVTTTSKKVYDTLYGISNVTLKPIQLW